MEQYNKWHSLDTAPTDELHLRGLWVCTILDSDLKLHWQVDCGVVASNGDFILSNGDGTGWCADDYEYWAPVPDTPQRE